MNDNIFCFMMGVAITSFIAFILLMFCYDIAFAHGDKAVRTEAIKYGAGNYAVENDKLIFKWNTND